MAEPGNKFDLEGAVFLTKRYTLITGASSGIGRAMACLFARQGHHLIVTARREERLIELTRELQDGFGVDVLVVAEDLSRPRAGRTLYEKCRGYELEALVNNAGIGDFSKIWETDLDKAQELLRLNIEALTEMSLCFVRDYKEKPVTLLNVSSIAGYKVFSNATLYSATKFYVSAFTEGLARSLSEQGKRMRVKLLAPAQTATEFLERATGTAVAEPEGYAQPSQVAEYAYELFLSDQLLGYVSEDGLKLSGPRFETGRPTVTS